MRLKSSFCELNFLARCYQALNNFRSSGLNTTKKNPPFIAAVWNGMKSESNDSIMGTPNSDSWRFRICLMNASNCFPHSSVLDLYSIRSGL